MSRKIFLSFALSLFFSICLFQICYFHFEKIRLNLSQDADGPHVEFSVDPLPRVGLVLLEFTRNSNADIKVEVHSPGQPIQILHLSDRKSRFYLQLKGLVQLHSSSSDWTLKRAELRNLYGSRNGIFSYVIIPAESQNYDRPGLPASVLLFVLLLLLRGAQASSLHRGPRASGLPVDWKSAIPYVLVLLFCGTALLLPYISSYRFLLATKTFLLILALLYFPALRKTYLMARSKAESISPEKGKASFQTALVVIAVFIFFLLQMMYSLREFNGNYSGFLVLSQKFVLNNPLLEERDDLKRQLIIQEGKGGYDAQFMYVMAFDPFLCAFSDKPRLYRKVVDSPPYRYGRIGFSLLTKIFSLNQPEFFPKTMIILLLLSHAAGAYFLARIAVFYGRSPYWALFYIVIPAFTVALRLGLPESIASALVMGAVFFYLREKILLTSLCLVVAILVRETTALFAVILIAREISLRRFGQAGMITLPLIVYLGWRGFIGWRLFEAFQWKGIFYGSEGINIPFRGIVALWRAVLRGEYIPEEIATAAMLFSFFLVALFLYSLYLLRTNKHFISYALVCYSLLAVSLDYRTVLTPILNAERVAYEAFIFALMAALTIKSRPILQLSFVVFFFLLFLYDWSALTYSSIFRAGFLWQTLTL